MGQRRLSPIESQIQHWMQCMGQNSSVSIASLYELDGPGIESKWWRHLPQQSRPFLWTIRLPV